MNTAKSYIKTILEFEKQDQIAIKKKLKSGGPENKIQILQIDMIIKEIENIIRRDQVK